MLEEQPAPGAMGPDAGRRGADRRLVLYGMTRPRDPEQMAAAPSEGQTAPAGGGAANNAGGRHSPRSAPAQNPRAAKAQQPTTTGRGAGQPSRAVPARLKTPPPVAGGPRPAPSVPVQNPRRRRSKPFAHRAGGLRGHPAMMASNATEQLARPKTPDYFAGKTIIITGAGSGIGRATANIFAREGANVVCADLNEAGVKETAAQVNAKGSQALALKVDVTKRAQVDDMVKRALDAFGTVQFLFNSAGAAIRRAKFLEIDDALMEKTFDLNVKGTLYGMQAVLPHMIENKFGVIVNVGSMAHRRGGPGSSIHYAASKGAVVTMTMGVAREFAQAGIRALSISPGPVKTPFQDAAQSSPELVQKFLDDVPMKRFGEPEEIGELVLFMCSDACPFMTADTVYVNGGGGWR